MRTARRNRADPTRRAQICNRLRSCAPDLCSSCDAAPWCETRRRAARCLPGGCCETVCTGCAGPRRGGAAPRDRSTAGGRHGSDGRDGAHRRDGPSGVAGELPGVRARVGARGVPPDRAVPGDEPRLGAGHRHRGDRPPEAAGGRRSGRGPGAHVPGGHAQNPAGRRAVPRGAWGPGGVSVGHPGARSHDGADGRPERRGALLRARRARAPGRAAVQDASRRSTGQRRAGRRGTADPGRDRGAMARQQGGRRGQEADAEHRAGAALSRTHAGGGGGRKPKRMSAETRLLAGPNAASILVIDDERQVRTVFEEALTGRGYSVDLAEDGKQAIEKVEVKRFDVVICDLKMPGIDGLETIRRIQAIHRDIQFIVITAHGTFESAIESLRVGAFDFLQKPVVLKDLLFSVGKALERRDLLERLALYELSRTIFSTLEPDLLYGRIVKAAIDVLGADDASLMLLDENRELSIAISTSLQQEILAATHLAIGERVAGRVAQQQEPAVINDDVTGDERFAGVRALRSIKAAIVCPLTMRGELLGVLNVNRVKKTTRYGERDRQSAMILSSLVALALGNARLHKELQARLQQISDTQEEVIQNEKMVALGSLLSGVAHELNNPLCAVLGYAQLMHQEDLEPRLRKGVEVITREADRAATIVSDLLRFSRRERPEKRALGLSGVLLKTLERKAYDLKSARVEVRTMLDAELPLVLGDFHQLQVVFTNLITNAQQAMFDHHGRGTLTIKGERNGGKVVLTFADDGPGISVAHARRVFDPFFTTKAVGQGTGLGLSVCFAIVRDHGGAPRLAGKPGPGATLPLQLPTAPPPTAAP